MERKKKIKAFKIIAIIILVITGCLLSFAIPLHISEIIDMQECAATPGCMYCIPAKSIFASIIYVISFVLVNIGIILFILYNTIKVKIK